MKYNLAFYFLPVIRKLLFLLVICFGCSQGFPTFEVGVATHRHVPMTLVGGIRLDAFVLRLEGMGEHNGDNHYWVSTRASFTYRFLKDLPFSLESGISCGHMFAKAPNKRNQAFNKANSTNFLWEYNSEELLDISLLFSARVFGFQSSVLVPVIKPAEDISYNLLWSFSYIIEL